MLRRVFDLGVALLVLSLTAPLILAGALGIVVSSPGPVFYRARRVGRDGRDYAMFKLRTMHVKPGGAAITGKDDARVFRLGGLLRRLKIDELPQFWNVLNGDMSIVGPRPEDPEIVAAHYTPWMRETLTVRPGITSPGAIWYYAHSDRLLDPADPEGSYIAQALTPKLALERAYMERADFGTDLATILMTVRAVLGQITGRPVEPAVEDRRAAEAWCPSSAFPGEAP